MKRALACPGKRSSSLTVSGEDLQFIQNPEACSW